MNRLENEMDIGTQEEKRSSLVFSPRRLSECLEEDEEVEPTPTATIKGKFVVTPANVANVANVPFVACVATSPPARLHVDRRFFDTSLVEMRSKPPDITVLAAEIPEEAERIWVKREDVDDSEVS